jgi:hypothetical protein
LSPERPAVSTVRILDSIRRQQNNVACFQDGRRGRGHDRNVCNAQRRTCCPEHFHFTIGEEEISLVSGPGVDKRPSSGVKAAKEHCHEVSGIVCCEEPICVLQEFTRIGTKLDQSA